MALADRLFMSTPDAPNASHAASLSAGSMDALGLAEQPLLDYPAADEYFTDEAIDMQVADIKQTLITSDDLLLITGEAGSGRSTLLRLLSDNAGLRLQCLPAQGSARFRTQNVLTGLLEAFHLPVPEDLRGMLDGVIPGLQALVERNAVCTILLDDADRVPDEELSVLLRSLLHLNGGEDVLLRLAMTCEPGLEERIPDLLPENTQLPYALLAVEPFDDLRASHYLAHRFAQAGSSGALPFSDDELAQLADSANGRPGALHALAADALNERFGDLEQGLPPELASYEGQGLPFTQRRGVRLALGALAAVMIAIGGLMFINDSLNQAPERRVVETQQLDPDADRIALLDEADDAPAQDGAAPTASSMEPSPDNDAPSASTPSAAPATASQQSSVSNREPTRPDDAAATTAGLANAGSGQDDIAPAAAAEPGAARAEAAPSQSDATTSSQAETGPSGEAPDSAAGLPDSATGERGVAAGQNDQSDAELAGDTDVSSTDATDTDSASVEGTAEDTGVSAPDEAAEAAADPATVATETAPAPAEQSEPAAEDAGGDDSATSPVDNPLSGDKPDPTVLAQAEARLESPNWILVQNAARYTVQLSAATDRASVLEFLARTDLPGPNSVYSFTRRGVTWHALVHGLYGSVAEAQSAVERMPAVARRDQPWIRSIARLQQTLRNP